MKLEKKHTDEIDLVRSEILSMKELLEKETDNKLMSRLKEREAKLKDLERIFSLQVKKYKEFQLKWREKWKNELLSK